MCRKCEPILGCIMKKHAEEECPLFQASYCPLCAQRGHFVNDCPNKAKSAISDAVEPIPTTPAELVKKSYVMADNNEAYVEYLKLYEIESSSRKEKNRTLVLNHLKSRGLTLVNPPTKAATPPAIF